MSIETEYVDLVTEMINNMAERDQKLLLIRLKRQRRKMFPVWFNGVTYYHNRIDVVAFLQDRFPHIKVKPGHSDNVILEMEKVYKMCVPKEFLK